jgi:poly-beta-1,6-N-acetyl-D-glucosamine synthase
VSFFLSSLLFTIAGLYVITFCYYFYHWLRKKQEPKESITNEKLSVSILIPVRDEEANILNLLSDLAQNSLDDSVEIIIIDDHSGDNTKVLANKFLSNQQDIFNYHVVDNHGEGKKSAIETGIDLAKGDYIVTLDADVRLDKGWRRTLTSYLIKNDGLIIMPVIIEGNGFLSAFQSLEQLALMFIAEASAKAGSALVCSGGNLAYSKKLFKRLNPYANNKHIHSGDDMFLLEKVRNEGASQVVPAFDSSLAAKTQSEEHWYSFVNQRVRWSKKMGEIAIVESKSVGIIIVLFCNLILLNSVLLIKYPVLSYSVLISLGLKFLIDFLLLFLTSKKLRQLNKMSYFPVSFLLYITLHGGNDISFGSV